MARFEKRCSNAAYGETRIPHIACACMAALVGILLFSSCGTRRARVQGTMYVPPGLQGNAQWGEVWLVHDSPELEYDLKERERLVTLALLGKDVEFLRRQLPAHPTGSTSREDQRLEPGADPDFSHPAAPS